MLSSLAAATGAVARRAEQTPIASPSATNSARVFGLAGRRPAHAPRLPAVGVQAEGGYRAGM